jgi:hypothetical protein
VPTGFREAFPCSEHIMSPLKLCARLHKGPSKSPICIDFELLGGLEPRTRRQLCERLFVREVAHTVTEHDLERPWIIRTREHRTIELDENAEFFSWAAERWPRDRFTVELDPWQLDP